MALTTRDIADSERAVRQVVDRSREVRLTAAERMREAAAIHERCREGRSAIGNDEAPASLPRSGDSATVMRMPTVRSALWLGN